MRHFTLRDVFWLIVVVGLVCGWYADRRPLAMQATETNRWKGKAEDLAEHCRAEGWRVEWQDIAPDRWSLTVQSSPPKDTKIAGIDMEKPDDRRLLAFCHAALLYTRGHAISPFAGSSDRQILDRLLSQPGFLPALDESRAVWEQRPEESDTADHRWKRDSYIGLLQIRNKTSEVVLKALSPEQRSKLPAVYLRMEGLMALCRPEFGNVLSAPETAKEIQDLSERFFSDRAALFHRSLFSLQTLDEAAFFEVELRQASREFDISIVQKLNAGERKRLGELIAKSSSLDQFFSR